MTKLNTVSDLICALTKVPPESRLQLMSTEDGSVFEISEKYGIGVIPSMEFTHFVGCQRTTIIWLDRLERDNE